MNFLFLGSRKSIKNFKYLGLIFLIYRTVLLNIPRKNLEMMFWYRSAQTLPSLPHQGRGTLMKYGWHCLLASRGKPGANQQCYERKVMSPLITNTQEQILVIEVLQCENSNLAIFIFFSLIFSFGASVIIFGKESNRYVTLEDDPAPLIG